MREYAAAIDVADEQHRQVPLPRTTSCERRSLPGLSSTGLNRTLGSSPHARACSACARPISPPSSATTELFDMFCALNGATLMPRLASIRQIPATTTLFPASEVVPATSRAPVSTGRPRHRGLAHRHPAAPPAGIHRWIPAESTPE